MGMPRGGGWGRWPRLPAAFHGSGYDGSPKKQKTGRGREGREGLLWDRGRREGETWHGTKREGMEKRREGREAWRPRPAPLPRLGSDTSSPTAALAKHPSHPITAEATAAKLNWKGMMGSRSQRLWRHVRRSARRREGLSLVVQRPLPPTPP